MKRWHYSNDTVPVLIEIDDEKIMIGENDYCLNLMWRRYVIIIAFVIFESMEKTGNIVW